jgi:GWxTD domain-containing protein
MTVSAQSSRVYCLTALTSFIVWSILWGSISLQAQSLNSPEPQGQVSAGQQEDPLKRPLPKKKQGTESFYKKWLEDVSVIITPEEMQAFKKLGTDAERDQYIEIFWQHRDPTPDTEENEYRDEYYRRLAYANEHFSAGVRGQNTDRGRIYILHGKPDSIDAHPAGGPYQRTAEEGGGETQTHPFEIWRYRHIEGVGQEIELEFVDTCGCGAYHLILDPQEKDALKTVPNAGLTFAEQSGLSTKAQRLNGSGSSLFGGNRESKLFDRMETLVRATAPPPVKFKDLEAIVTAKIRYNLLPFDVQVDFVKASSDTVLVPITIQVANRELTYVNKDGMQRASLNIFGRVTSVTGRVVQTFEEPLRLEQPAELFTRFISNVSVYQKMLPLRPGLYRLDMALKDVNGDKLGTIRQRVLVPDYSDEKLAASSLIVADVMEMVPASEVGTGGFIIGIDKVRPRVAAFGGKPATFKHNQKVNLWMEVYNLAVDEKTRKPSATVVYEIVDMATNKPVMYVTETTNQLANLGDHVTLEKSLLPNQLNPGTYQVTIKINDLISRQTISPTAKFAVE